ncbi:MAG: phosphate/phosphite/phosphonate ABC transporter substrate-binding protein [Bdellovibrionota bacterium]
MKKRTVLALLLPLSLMLSGCFSNKAELGSEKNPVKLFFIPSVDAKVIESNSKAFKEYLEANTPYKFEINIPQSYVAVVEAFGTKRADVAAMTTFSYLLAHDKYGAEALITVLRHGEATYKAMFVAKAGGPIKTVADLNGKKVAFVDPASTSGYILPMKLLKSRNVVPKETVFAAKHDNVISMVYQGQVDGGAAFYTPPGPDGKLDDARRLVLTQYPDVEKKVAIIELTDAVPNDPVIFRKELPPEMKTKIVDALLAFVKTPEGAKAFKEIYAVTDLKKATDADYDIVRGMLKELGKDPAELMKK